jgi:hypothetical protein
MRVDVCRQCADPVDAGRIFCKKCGATLRPSVPLIQSHDQSVTDVPQQKRESGGSLVETLFAPFDFLLGADELFFYLLVPLVVLVGVYLVTGMVYHWMFDPNAVDVASRADLLSIDPDRWFPRS